jgi:hypothetical protein
VTPVHCISHTTGEFGDCWRACIASILDLTADDVPNFFHIADRRAGDGPECNKLAYDLAREWLAERGLGIFRVWVTGEWSLEKVLDQYGTFSPEVPFIVHGTPAGVAQGEEAHAVLALGRKLLHDPSGAGIGSPCLCTCKPDCPGLWWLDVISFAVPREQHA